MFGTWGDFVNSDYRLANYLIQSGYKTDVCIVMAIYMNAT